MKRITTPTILGIAFLFLTPGLYGQTDSLEENSKAERIEFLRIQLIEDFQNAMDDELSWHLEKLEALEDSATSVTVWDERWLLYHHLGRYDTLFEQVKKHTQRTRFNEMWKEAPPEDSLFIVLDNHIYKHLASYAELIRQRKLNKEQQLFAILHLEYLLRVGETDPTSRKEQDRKLIRFVEKYPQTEFKPFINEFMFKGTKPEPWAYNLDLGFRFGAWTDELERHFSPYYAFDCALGAWYKGLNTHLRLSIGGFSLERDIVENNNVWFEDEKATHSQVMLDVGYDIVNTKKLRIFPTIGAGWSWVNPPSPDEDEDPLPAYYDDFRFNAPTLQAVLNTDLKFRIEDEDQAFDSYGYFGIRLRLGYQRLFLGNKNEALAGDQLFFSISMSPFWREAKKKKL